MASDNDAEVPVVTPNRAATHLARVAEVRDSALATGQRAVNESRALLVQASGGLAKIKNKVLEKPGIRETEERVVSAVNKLADAVENVLDNATGKAMLDEIRALVEHQGLYNDVLATKLAEALDRLEHIESRAASLEARLLKLEQHG